MLNKSLVRHDSPTLFPLCVVLCLLLLAACNGELANSTAIPEVSAIMVAPEFAAFYEEFGGRFVFGDPISEAFTLEVDGPTLQYFQAMRLEYHDDDEAPERQRVTVFPLGEWDMARFNAQPSNIALESVPSRYFPETGQIVKGAFLVFYEANGGELLFGSPISTHLDHDGRLVQYFRNGRLDWRPELPEGQRVQVAFLGQAHFDATMNVKYPQALGKQVVPATSVSAVDLYASVQHPVLYNGDEQVLHVAALSIEGRSVSGLTVIISLSSGETTWMRELHLADDENQARVVVNPGGLLEGQRVELIITALGSNGDVLGTDRLTYKTWW
jgi:hypothetical protein